MSDFGTTPGQMNGLDPTQAMPRVFTPVGYAVGKRAFDILFCLLLLPILCAVAFFLLLANRVVNPGPILFMQPRMGRNCAPFMAYKFRTMTPSARMRRANDPLEQERITCLGATLRQSRLDELPQIINVLRGEMSLIGPRPDCYDHAITFLRDIPGYRDRHAVLPGISGFAQTEIGYAEGTAATVKKVEADLHYIANRSLRFEAWIFWRTLVTVIGRAGR
ncbi:sugar transferase [Aliiroseovarius sp. S1339]|uniref:sugar transferase n=1 Tax=Aliiroseovarius sp. S1339 TaxID=2936990 RepID=UPI0020C02F94|nr:sugar transferase [Aliiroseovarius sp. S1339]MCK8463442.1 sugar transferase [Aliiroseovarius sp. S1339]